MNAVYRNKYKEICTIQPKFFPDIIEKIFQYNPFQEKKYPDIIPFKRKPPIFFHKPPR
jgi:hypothetical protein